MKLLDADGTWHEKRKLKQLEKVDKDGIKIGFYYSKLSSDHKARFNRIVGAIARSLNIHQYRSPFPMILVRQIAFNTLRIEQAELDILEGREERYNSQAEKWLLLEQKERREAMGLLATLTQTLQKKGAVSRFKDLRNVVREEEGLPESSKEGVAQDGHQRRHYDKVTRTK